MALQVHRPLAAASRVRGIPAHLEIPVLALLGAVAAYLAMNVDFGIRAPGHSILRCVFPLAFGLAIVPRRHAGAVMGSAALATVLVQGLDGGAPGLGSATSLVLAGPLLDLAARRARSGRGVYLALVAGGVAANVAAFAVRLGAKVILHDGSRPLAAWWPEAALSYVLCGAIAGAASAAVWFRFGARVEE
jgi:hypothetical protein